jgi:arginase
LPPYSILEAPSILGLSPTGVESLPEALLGAGLRIGLQAESSDLSIVTGRGPQILMDIEERKPLVRDEDVVLFGQRDAEEAMQYGSQDILATNIHVYDLTVVRKLGIDRAAAQAIEILQRPVLAGFWLHLDVDVLDDAIMPAVDYRIPDGFSFAELRTVLRLALASGRIVGMDVTIFNPRLDIDGSIARKVVTTLVEGQARLPWLPNAD